MSMDKGLKPRSSLSRHRNVLKRDERIGWLQEVEKWQEGQSALGLPKVAHRKVAVKKKAAAKAAVPGAEGEAAAAGAEGEAAAAAPAAGKAGAAPAAAKAPAAKAGAKK